MSDSETFRKGWYDLVRRDDGQVMASYQYSFEERVLLYRYGNTFTFRPLQADEIIGNLSLFSEMLLMAGYRLAFHSDIVNSSA
ncbi:hypothetical protein LEADMM068B1_06595 [Leclercia adecarboxylata]|uniref:hypothetical protein n=1 Tax=Leclercia adecarboxylata TaxID=83655 RepID=UPI003B251636